MCPLKNKQAVKNSGNNAQKKETLKTALKKIIDDEGLLESIVKSIPEVLEKGAKADNNGRVAIEYKNIRVGLNDKWDNQKLENKWVISSYEIYNSESEPPFLLMAQLQEVGLGTPKLAKSRSSANALQTQENSFKKPENLNETPQEAKNLSPLEQAQAEKRAKLEREANESEQDFLRAKEQETKRKEALKRTLKLIEELNNGVKQASEEIRSKARDLEHAITPLKEFGKNYPEFALRPKEALEKLLQEKNGQVAGAFYRDDLGGIDFVWGNKDYGLEHILKRREEQAIGKGLNEAEAKEYALNIAKTIPEVIDKGVKVEQNGRVAIEYQNIRVGLKDNWKGEKLPNHWIITGYEKTENSESLYAHPLITKSETLPLNSIEPDPTQKPLTSQGDLLKKPENLNEITQVTQNLSPLEQAQAEKRTLELIEELNNGVKQASEEIRSKAFDFSNEKLTNEQIKALLNNAEIPTSGRDAVIFGKNNLTPEIVEFMHKNNKKMIIEKASNKEIELLQDVKFKHPENIRASLDHEAITHILKRHGAHSVKVRNGEIPITYEDIAHYRDIVKNADEILRTIDKYGEEAITAFKQINGYAVVVEQAINRKSELVLKTMYKSNGSYKNNDVYQEFSSTSLDANAKVPHRLSSYSGATENPTQKPLTSQEDLLKKPENLNETPQEAKNLSPLEQAQAEKRA
ncbi:DUF3519 domain-containing protein, partial [Helicobacter acinonychis]|uniref:DUF3519 domain-containing protein n=2 Tax=Helicobacter acinonychis TaxID=212 RepID=UPI00349F1B63